MTDEEEPMIDYGSLAMAVATAIASGAGKQLIDWLKRRFDSKAVDTLVADPNNDSAKEKLANLLQTELGKRPYLTDELRSLLDQVGADYAPQTSTVSGGSTNIQIQGNNNQT